MKPFTPIHCACYSCRKINKPTPLTPAIHEIHRSALEDIIQDDFVVCRSCGHLGKPPGSSSIFRMGSPIPTCHCGGTRHLHPEEAINHHLLKAT